MSGKPGNPARDAILRRIEGLAVHDDDRPANLPLDWDDIGFLVQGLSFANRPVLAASRAVTERYSLGPRGAWMLNLIAAGVVFPNELSEVFQIGRSLVSAELTRLSEAGLIESRPGETDRRRSELALTDKGTQARNEVRGELQRTITTALAGYTPDEIRLVARVLRDVRDGYGTSVF